MERMSGKKVSTMLEMQPMHRDRKKVITKMSIHRSSSLQGCCEMGASRWLKIEHGYSVKSNGGK